MTDYGCIDLREITWQLETAPAADFHGMELLQDVVRPLKRGHGRGERKRS
ncbi:hypothetical protein ACF1BN_03725 [Streptomyces sp. NPDC014861]